MKTKEETPRDFDPVAYVRTIRKDIPPDSPRRIERAWQKMVRDSEEIAGGELRPADFKFIVNRLAADIERRDGPTICERVHIHNKLSRAVFEALTDQPLPKNQRGTNDRVYAWLKKEAEKDG